MEELQPEVAAELRQQLEQRIRAVSAGDLPVVSDAAQQAHGQEVSMEPLWAADSRACWKVVVQWCRSVPY